MFSQVFVYSQGGLLPELLPAGGLLPGMGGCLVRGGLLPEGGVWSGGWMSGCGEADTTPLRWLLPWSVRILLDCILVLLLKLKFSYSWYTINTVGGIKTKFTWTWEIEAVERAEQPEQWWKTTQWRTRSQSNQGCCPHEVEWGTSNRRQLRLKQHSSSEKHLRDDSEIIIEAVLSLLCPILKGQNPLYFALEFKWFSWYRILISNLLFGRSWLNNTRLCTKREINNSCVKIMAMSPRTERTF